MPDQNEIGTLANILADDFGSGLHYVGDEVDGFETVDRRERAEIGKVVVITRGPSGQHYRWQLADDRLVPRAADPRTPLITAVQPSPPSVPPVTRPTAPRKEPTMPEIDHVNDETLDRLIGFLEPAGHSGDKLVGAVAEELRRLRGLVRKFADAGNCSLDHNGACQEHGYRLAPDELCPHAEAKPLMVGWMTTDRWSVSSLV